MIRQTVNLLAIGLWGYTVAGAQEPIAVNYCELMQKPAVFNGKRVRVKGFIAREPDLSILFEPECRRAPDLWLTIAKRFGDKGGMVRGTATGRFKAGSEAVLPGLGNLGCCRELVVDEQILVEKEAPTHLDSQLRAGDGEAQLGCNLQEMVPRVRMEDEVAAQWKAETPEGAWAFGNARRVAGEGLGKVLQLAHFEESTLVEVGEQRPGRHTYEWRDARQGKVYRVKVSRPFWLTHVAKDAEKIAWVTREVVKVECGGGG